MMYESKKEALLVIMQRIFDRILPDELVKSIYNYMHHPAPRFIESIIDEARYVL